MRVPGWALVVSAAAHGALVMALGAGWSGHDVNDGVAASAAATTPIRWVVSTTAPALPTVAATPVAPPEPVALPVEPPVPDPAAVPQRADADPMHVMGSTSKPPALDEAVLPPGADTVTASTAAEPVDGYLPRKALTVPPYPLADIALSWPAGVWTLGRQAAVFTVFIDETGVVRKMVADGPTLLPTLEATARETFGATRFAPGEVDGRPVKAMIRVEVVFDASLPRSASPGLPFPTVVSRQNL